MDLIKINAQKPEASGLAHAVAVLRRGGVIIYPTDTIYGLGCDITNKKAVERILKLKGRDAKKPMSILCADLKHLSDYAIPTRSAYRIMKRLLPGPYTVVLFASRAVPKLLVTKQKTVGIRVPDHAVARALVKALGNPIITTSVNLAGAKPMDDPKKIAHEFGEKVDCIIDAGRVSGEPSTVLDLTSDEPVVLRPGVGKWPL